MATYRKVKLKSGAEKWEAQVRVTGHAPQSRRFDDRAEARLWGTQTEARLMTLRGRSSSLDRDMRVAELLAMAQSRKAGRVTPDWLECLRSHFEFWASELGAMKVTEVTSSMVEAAWLRSENQSPAVVAAGKRVPLAAETMNKRLMILAEAFEIALDNDAIHRNPVRSIKKMKVSPGRVRFLSDEERQRVITAARVFGYRWETYVRMAYGTGARQAELLGLRVRDVNLETREVRFVDTKNGESRMVAVPEHALFGLKRLCHERLRSPLKAKTPKGPDELVFEWKRHPAFTWEKIRTAADLKGFTWHDMRHTCASYLAMSGVTLREIGDVLGHKDIRSVMRYSHLRPGFTTSAIDRAAERFG